VFDVQISYYEVNKLWSTGMSTFIEEYIEIENDLRNHHKRGQLIAQLLARHPDIGHTSFADLLTMLDQLKHSPAKIRFPLFAQLIYLVLEREIEAENWEAMLVMLQNTELLERYASMQKTSKIALIDRYLQHDPNNREALIQKAAWQADILYFALHELPRGVIDGWNGATAEGCLGLLDFLEEYQSVCQQLQLDRSNAINYYAMHFHGYRDYLLHRHLYKNYKDYIQQHNLELAETQNYDYVRSKSRKT